MLKVSAACASLALGALAVPQPPIAPITTRYRVETKNETTVDLSGFGQPSQQANFGLVSWIAVTVSDTANGRTVHVVVDSMKYDGVIPMLTQATADSAKSGVVHGLVDRNGRLKDLTASPAANVLLADVQGVIYSLFPRVKTGAKAGDGWSDTVEVTNNSNGANIKSRFLINYTAGSQETVAGIAAMKLNAASTATVSGTMENPMAGTVEVEGSIKGTSVTLVGPDGRYLGGTSNSTSDQVIKTPMAPAPIPLKVVRSVTVTLIP